jgi:predicted nucleotidyltransferase
MTTSELPIAIDREKLAVLCHARGVRKLSLFGSVIRDDFDPSRSDIDILVEYLQGRHPGTRHFDFQDELTEMFGRKIDLCTPPMLGDFIRKDAMANTHVLYEHA